MKRYAAILWLLAALAVLSACGAQTLPAGEDDFAPAGTAAQAAEEDRGGGKVVYVATWMQEHSVVYYDEQLNRTVESGGDLTEEEIRSREDIDPAEMYTTAAQPNTKVEYDLHGVLQNIYYLGGDGEYYLDPATAAAMQP